MTDTEEERTWEAASGGDTSVFLGNAACMQVGAPAGSRPILQRECRQEGEDWLERHPFLHCIHLRGLCILKLCRPRLSASEILRNLKTIGGMVNFS